MITWRHAHDAARLAFAAVGVAAIADMIAFLRITPTADFRPGNFFGFFTIQTNLLAIGLLAAVVVVPREERTSLFDAVRGAITLSTAFVLVGNRRTRTFVRPQHPDPASVRV